MVFTPRTVDWPKLVDFHKTLRICLHVNNTKCKKNIQYPVNTSNTVAFNGVT
jgi:hypothetical protein